MQEGAVSEAAQIVVLATLDTKGPEVAYMADLLRRCGQRPCLMDTGFRHPPACRPDVDREQVARAAGLDPASVRLLPRDEAIRAMGEGAGGLLARGAAEGRYAGVIALGGNQGTAIAGIALRRLPFGVPKVVSRPVLEAATAAIAGMVGSIRRSTPGAQPAIAITAFGNTQGAVAAVHALLRERGREAVAFHASGAGGSAMEELIEAGVFDGLLDLTTHELAGEICGQDVYAPTRPGRLTAAAQRGLPQVVAPGGLDYFCFAAAETIPEAYRGRAIHRHNPYNANVRTSAPESARLGELVAARLNSAPPGTAAFLYPQRGWSEVGRPGGPLHDPEANGAFLESLRAALSPSVELHVLDLAINDRGFATLSVEVLERLLAAATRRPTS